MKILAFGDSITDGSTDAEGGWANRLQRHFMAQNAKREVDEKYDWFYNLGISGNTAPDIIKRLDTETSARLDDQADEKIVIVIAIGVNDSRCEGAPDNPIFSEEEFSANLTQIVKLAHVYTDKLVFVGLPPAGNYAIKTNAQRSVQHTHHTHIGDMCRSLW